MSKGIAFINNKFVPLEKAVVPVTDMVVQRSYGATEVLRTYHRKAFAFDEHFRRLQRSLRLLGLPQRFSESFLRRVIERGVAKISGEVHIKILVTGGPGYQVTADGRPQLIFMFVPLVLYGETAYRRGVRVATSHHIPVLPEAKTTSYLAAVLAHREALRAGFDEVLFTDASGSIVDGATFSFAIIKGRDLITPVRGVLAGVTMDIVKKLARSCGLRVVVRSIRKSELATADEAFETSTLREVIPVVQVDNIRIGSGKPGKYAKMLLEAFRDYAGNKNTKISKRLSVGRGNQRLPGRRRHRE